MRGDAVATDVGRDASRSHAFDSPLPGEGRERPNGPARRRGFLAEMCATSLYSRVAVG
jgi:hypothetical protein